MNIEYRQEHEHFDSSAFFPTPTFKKLMPIHEKIGTPYELIVANQTDFVDFSTKYYARGYEICAVSPDYGNSLMLTSPLFRAARFGGMPHEWIDNFRRYKETAGDDKPCMTIEYKPIMTSALTRLEKRIGLEADPVNHDAVLNIGAFHFAPVFEMTQEGLFIIALSHIPGEKGYIPWDSNLNPRHDRLVESSMVESIEKLDQFEIELPFSLAA